MVNVLDYFDDEKIKMKDCIVNNPKKKFVFREVIGNEVFFIKKYTPHGKKALRINLFVKRDRAEHYEYISNELKKIDIPHIEPLKVVVKKKSFFKRESLVVTKDGGEVFEDVLRRLELKTQKEMIDIYFNYYVKMAKNKIYVTDYNLSGALIGNDGVIRLIDFDAYKKRYYLTRRLKNRILEEIHKGNDLEVIGGFSEEIAVYMKNKIKQIIKEIGLD
ncbi:hypothetical protein [Cetobacterium sp. ZWU0022]|uniref:hypothetical protein n=1 Tax=Cetobacterium sp. ZWU0022 TaxID=1340502 RepID=UPI00064871B1|nr:hypothetical protein [Cetobacterium sp. ZWU0022]